MKPSTVALVFQHLNALLEWAVEDGLIARNPARGVKLPALSGWRSRAAHGRAGRGAVRLGGVVVPPGRGAWGRPRASPGGGVRAHCGSGAVAGPVGAGQPAVEQSAAARRLRAAQDTVERPDGAGVVVRARRPGRACRTATRRVRAASGGGAGGLPGVRSSVAAGAQAGGPRRHPIPHLRHAFASMLISAGCSVKAVSKALGHASAATTLNLYSHLWLGGRGPDQGRRRPGAGSEG